MLFIRYLKYLSKQPLSLKGSIQERETLTSLKNEGNEIQFQPNCWAIFHASLTPPQNSGQVKGTLESGRCTDLLERGRQWGYCLVKDSLGQLTKLDYGPGLVAQWVRASSHAQKVSGLIPGQDHTSVAGSFPCGGTLGRQPVDVSLFLPYPLGKINKNVLG